MKCSNLKLYKQEKNSLHCTVMAVNNYFQKDIISCSELVSYFNKMKKTNPTLFKRFNGLYNDNGYFSIDLIGYWLEKEKKKYLTRLGVLKNPNQKQVMSLMDDSNNFILVDIENKHTYTLYKIEDKVCVLDSLKDDVYQVRRWDKINGILYTIYNEPHLTIEDDDEID